MSNGRYVCHSLCLLFYRRQMAHSSALHFTQKRGIVTCPPPEVLELNRDHLIVIPRIALLLMPNTALDTDIAEALHTDCLGRPMQYHNSVPSTNAVAADWARRGAPEGAVVLAEHQTEGRGRHGRSWIAPPHQALTGSVILRPALKARWLTLIPLAASLAVSDAIAVQTPIRPSIKWPNDVLIDGRKCCGMLLETTLRGTPSDAGAATFVVLGIGCNVNQTAFPDAVPATSIRLATGQPHPRAALWAAIMKRLETHYDALHTASGRRMIRHDYEACMLHRGTSRTVRRLDASGQCTGTVLGITPEGALRMETAYGERTFSAGEITTRPA